MYFGINCWIEKAVDQIRRDGICDFGSMGNGKSTWQKGLGAVEKTPEILEPRDELAEKLMLMVTFKLWWTVAGFTMSTLVVSEGTVYINTYSSFLFIISKKVWSTSGTYIWCFLFNSRFNSFSCHFKRMIIYCKNYKINSYSINFSDYRYKNDWKLLNKSKVMNRVKDIHNSKKPHQIYGKVTIRNNFDWQSNLVQMPQ